LSSNRFEIRFAAVLPRIGFYVNQIISRFGGADQLRTAVNQRPSLLYAA
jgi:hypothetical protein